jgi:hypothetical protein
MWRQVTSIPKGSPRNFSRPTQPEVLEARDPSGPWRSPFRPSPESWAYATTEALAHLKATGVISQVPEVPQYAQKSSIPNTGITSSSSDPSSRAAEVHIEISADSHFKQVAPGVSLYSPSSSEQTGTTPVSQHFQSQQSNKLVRMPSDRSTELPYRRIREKEQANQKRNVTIYSSILSSDYLAEHEEEGDEQKSAPSEPPSRTYRDECSPGYPTSRHIDPLGDPPRYAARSPPIPGSIADASPHIPHLSAIKTHEKQESLTSDETILNLACYSFPDTPSHRHIHIPPAPQHSLQKRHREEPVAFVEGGVQQSRWDCERRRDDYPLHPPPYGTTQSPGRAPINPGTLYRMRRYQAERDFPGALRDDPWTDGMSSSPARVSSPSVDTPYGPQDSRASPAPLGRPGTHRSFLTSPLSSESRAITPEIDLTRPQNHRGDTTPDRRPSAITEDVPQARQPSSAGHSAGFDKRPTAEHVGHCHLRGVRSRRRDLPAMSGHPRELPALAQPLPPTPLSHYSDEIGSRYHGHSEHRHFGTFGSHPAARSSIATSATPYDGSSATGSTVRSLSQLSTHDDPQDELHDCKVDFVSVHPHRTEDDRAFYSDALGEYQHEEEGVAPDQDFLRAGRQGAVEAIQSEGHGTPVSNHPWNHTNVATASFKKEVDITQAPQTVIIPPIGPARSLRLPNAEDEAPLHVDEFDVPSRKPLSRMEKALLRRVEFGSHVDHSKIQLT